MSDNTPYQAPESEVLDSNNIDFANTLFFSTRQRIGRLRWLVYSMVSQFGMMFIVGIASAILIPIAVSDSNNDISTTGAGVVIVLTYAAIFVVGIILNRRRLHDLDKTGWLTLLIFVPLINLFFALYLLFAPGTQGENSYGLKPKTNSILLWIIGLILPIVFIGIIAAIAIPAYSDYSERAKMSQSE